MTLEPSTVTLVVCYPCVAEKIVTLESAYFKSYRDFYINPYILEYLTGAVLRYLNASAVNSREETPSLFYDLNYWKSSSSNIYYKEYLKVKTLMLFKESEHFMYCRTKNFKQKTDILAALRSPFDSSTWIMLILFIASVCLMPGFRFCYGMSIVAILFLQSAQVKKAGFSIVLLAVIIIPLQSAYQTYYTSSAVKPFHVPYIEKTQELFDSGFRIFCSKSGNISCSDDFLFEYNASFRMLSLDWNNVEQYFLDATLWDTEDHPDVGTHLIEGSDKIRFVWEETTQSTECHMLTEPFVEDVRVLFYAGIYSQTLYNTFGILLQAGIAEFWKSVLQNINDRGSSKIVWSIKRNTEDSEIAFMNNSIQALLKVFMVLEAFSILAFIAEISSIFILAKWFSWRERRKYLRAIWPLGKI